MNHLIRILNDDDSETLAWLCKHVGDVRVANAARHLGGHGKPYLSAVCRYLGVRPPALKTAPSAIATLPRSVSCSRSVARRL
jgi:hypothetical protein